MNNEPFEGFTHHDVALRYVTSYMHLAFRKSTPTIIRQMYVRLIMSDVDGPLLKISIPSETTFPIEESLAILPARDRLKNYSTDDVKDLDQKHMANDEEFKKKADKIRKQRETKGGGSMYILFAAVQ